jgi:hypothetical protein
MAMQSLNSLPEYIACLRGCQHQASMTAITLHEMKTELAQLATEEWARRCEKDPNLARRVFTPAEVLELEELEDVSYVNFWSFTPHNPAVVKVAPGLNEPTFSVNTAADACHVKHGSMGTLYLIGYPDCNRNNRIRHIEYHAAPECRKGWASTFVSAIASEPAMVYHGIVEPLIEGEEQMRSLPLCVSDGDKGLKEAMVEQLVTGFRCSNHRADNVQKKHGVTQSEFYKLVAKAPNQQLFDQAKKKLTQACAAYVDQVHPSEWAVAHSDVLAEGGSLDTQLTNNVGEQLNNALELARRQPTPMGALHEVVKHDEKRWREIQKEAHACKAPLPPRPAQDLADALLRVKDFKSNAVEWLDGNVRLKGRVSKRSDAEASVVCCLVRVGPNRVECECECKYASRDGMGCDHGMLLAQQGGKAHVLELVPFRMTTEAWKLQYPQDYSYASPTDSDMVQAIGKGGQVVRTEAGVGAFEETQLLPVMAMKRQRGRPSKDDFARMDPHRAKAAAATLRPTLNAIGELVLIEKNKCGKCGQRGHSTLKCQGRGFVASLVDRNVSAVYRAKQAEEVSVTPGTYKSKRPPQTGANPPNPPAKSRKVDSHDLDAVDEAGHSQKKPQGGERVLKTSTHPESSKAPASSFFQLVQRQQATTDPFNGHMTCFGPECTTTVGPAGSHSCSWCHRVMHAFCGILNENSAEGYNQVVDCKTQDCIALRPAHARQVV